MSSGAAGRRCSRTVKRCRSIWCARQHWWRGLHRRLHRDFVLRPFLVLHFKFPILCDAVVRHLRLQCRGASDAALPQWLPWVAWLLQCMALVRKRCATAHATGSKRRGVDSRRGARERWSPDGLRKEPYSRLRVGRFCRQPALLPGVSKAHASRARRVDGRIAHENKSLPLRVHGLGGEGQTPGVYADEHMSNRHSALRGVRISIHASWRVRCHGREA